MNRQGGGTGTGRDATELYHLLITVVVFLRTAWQNSLFFNTLITVMANCSPYRNVRTYGTIMELKRGE